MNQTMVKIVKPKKMQSKDDGGEAVRSARLDAILAKGSQKSLADQIAGHFFFHRGYYWPGCKQAFPNNLLMQHVDKFYPMAEGGPLFIDEVEAADNRNFEVKKEVMKKLGHRYLVIKPNMTLLEAFEALA